MQDVRELIKELSSLGYSQRQIGDASGLSQITVGLVARGAVTPRPETREKIVEGYKRIIEKEKRIFSSLKEANETLETIKGA